jgi:aldose 1-epimerase
MGPPTTITSRRFGQLPDGQTVEAYVLHAGDAHATVLTYGGIVQRLVIGGRSVLLGYDDLSTYVSGEAFLGAMVGRFANRIAGGRYRQGGHSVELETNENGNTLHGGPGGFHSKLWTASILQTDHGSALRLSLTSPNGDQGFPGELNTDIFYELVQHGAKTDLRLTYEAQASSPTLFNPTFHGYFNLASDKTIEGHSLQVAADRFTPTDAEGIPTGEIAPVSGALDLRKERLLGDVIEKTGGLDYNYVLSQPGGLQKVSTLSHQASSTTMEVHTDRPAIQVYTGDGLSGDPYPPFAGVALETQSFPDSPNQPNFPSAIVRPGEAFRSQTVYRFGPLR